MSSSQPSPVIVRFFVGLVTLMAGATVARSAQPEKATAAAEAPASPAPPAPAPDDSQPQRDSAKRSRFENMAARMLALSLHDTARYARIERGDTTAPAALRFGGDTLGVMIATVPDPVDSHEDWLFDAYIEVLRRAHEHRGYVIDRLWLPWALGADSVLKERGKTPVRALFPGVLLFRSLQDSSAAGKPLWRLVFLVGEVPTAGPHPRALARALAERDALLGDPAGRTLAVLGPSFSGSAPGLQAALSRWIAAGNGRHATVVTGSATSGAVRGLFGDASRFTFYATINTDVSLAAELASRVIPRLGLKPAQLAIVAEGSTAYGQAFATATQRSTRRDSVGPLQLSFPLNVAMLRADRTATQPATLQMAPGGPVVTLNLTDPPRPMEGALPTSELTAPTVDIELDQLARTLRNHDVRAVAIVASDIRDRIFLVTQLRKRLRDVHFILLEGNHLYLAPKYNPDLVGAVVLSSYPLIPESQLWGGRRQPIPFADETAEALYNATLIQLGDTALVDFVLPDSAWRQKRPPVWTSVVGGSGLMPLTASDVRSTATDFVTSAQAKPDPRLDFLEFAIVIALFCVSLLLLWRNVAHLRRISEPANTAHEKIEKNEKNEEKGEEAEKKKKKREDVATIRAATRASLESHESLYRLLQAVAVMGGVIPPTVVICAGALSAPNHFQTWAAAGLAVLTVRTLFVALALAAVAVRRCNGSQGGALARRMALLAPVGDLWNREKERRRKAWKDLRDMWRIDAWARDLVGMLSLFYLAATLAYAIEIGWRAWTERLSFTLLFYRAWRTDSGVSPLLPLGLAAAAFVGWCGWHLRRVKALKQTTAFEAACVTRDAYVILDDPDAPVPDPRPREFLHWDHPLPPQVVAGVRRARERLFRIVPLPMGGWLALALLLSCGSVFVMDDRSLEHLAGWETFDLVYRFGLVGVLTVTAWAVFRLVAVWNALKRTLRGIGGTPLITAFERLPQRISRLGRLGFIGVPRSTVIAPVAAAQWRHLKRLTDSLAAPAPPPKPAPAEGLLAKVGGTIAALLWTAPPPPAPALPAPPHGGEEDLRAAARKYGQRPQPYPGLGKCGDEVVMGANFLALADTLKAFWDAEPTPAEVTDVAGQVEKESGTRGSGPSTSGRFRRTFSEDLGLWIRAAEEFAAVQVVDYVEWVISQLRTLAGFLFLSLILLSVHISSYPFVPESLVKLLLFAILVLTIVAVVTVMVEMNRDEVLSRIARTEPGKVSWNWQFIVNMLVFGLVPLLTLISSEFPGIRDFLFAWVPALTRLAGHG
ncbi:MAG: hypothetical protein ACJ8GN_25770 [Longimicrobiaceae bacterium]